MILKALLMSAFDKKHPAPVSLICLIASEMLAYETLVYSDDLPSLTEQPLEYD